MKPEKKQAYLVQISLTLIVVAIAIMLISEKVKAGSAYTLVVENNTNATITATENNSCGGVGECPYREIPPFSTVTIRNFLPAGYASVLFEASCVKPKVDSVTKSYIVEPGGKKIKYKYLQPSDFGRSYIQDEPGCGYGANCEHIIGEWNWDQYGTVTIKKGSTVGKGSTTHKDTGNVGKWRCENDKIVVIDWTIDNETVTDRLSIKDNGKRLQGRNNKKMGINATKK